MTSSSVVIATPRARISPAAPSMMRCRVARPFAVNFWTCESISKSGAFGPMSPNTTQLSDRKALITGSTTGLGAATARALAAHGAFVIVNGRNSSRGEAVVDEIRSRGGLAAFVDGDLGAGTDEIHHLVNRATTAAGGHIDILVNNAATLLMPTPTAEITH